MPDIGLLQGPARPRAIPVAPVAGPEVNKVAAHSAVVSAPERPVAVISMEPEALSPPAANAPVGPVEAVDPVATAAPAEPAEPAAPAAPVAPLASAAPDPTRAEPARTNVRAPQSRGELPPLASAGASIPAIRIPDLLWLLLALVVVIGTGLGIRDPWPADEPRFVSLARDMANSHEWLFPRVGGDLYQDKPPLFFWLLALSFKLFGSVKAAYLVPSFLAAAGVVFMLYDFGRRTVSREAGLGAALLVSCTLQFVLAMRGAQIDPVLCLLTTFSVYALLRHLLLGDGWRWYTLAGFAAGLGVFTKGVGFLPLLMLIPFFLLRGFRWNGLATLDAGRGGWRWWLAPLAMVLAISLWFVPMLVVVATSGSPEYASYRDEILFKQTVGRYAAAWHHVRAWYYFLADVIPSLWMPASLLLFWLVPRFKAAYHARDARVWLPLSWVMLVVLFFSMSPGKRGIYILPALPALALASLPVLTEVLARRGVRVAGLVLGIAFLLVAAALTVGHAMGAKFAVDLLADAGLSGAAPLYVFLALCGLGLILAWWRAPLLAWPVTLGSLTIVFSYLIAPAMNGQRSGRDFMGSTLEQVRSGELLGLVAYKEQFLLYLDRPTVNFGHRRWQEGPQEFFDAAAWLNAAPDRVLLVPEDGLKPRNRFEPAAPAVACFTAAVTPVGRSSDDEWFLVRGPAEAGCAARGNAARAIGYPRDAL